MIYGYIRVSSKDQKESRQIYRLSNYGITTDNMFIDKQTGSNFNRPNYQRLLTVLQPNDVIVITSLDRLGRNYTEMIEQWDFITKQKQSNIVVLDMPMLDTRQERNMTDKITIDILLRVNAAFCQQELDYSKQRQAEGIALALAAGKHFGRQPKMKPNNFNEVQQQWLNGKISLRTAGKLLGVAASTAKRWLC